MEVYVVTFEGLDIDDLDERVYGTYSTLEKAIEAIKNYRYPYRSNSDSYSKPRVIERDYKKFYMKSLVFDDWFNDDLTLMVLKKPYIMDEPA